MSLARVMKPHPKSVCLTLAVCYRRQELPTPQWLARAERPSQRRSSLPKPAQAEKSVSLWSIIKDVVGKDLTRVCLPVYFNEPLSALQRTAEDLEYSELADEVQSAGMVTRFPWTDCEVLLNRELVPVCNKQYSNMLSQTSSHS